MEAENKIEGLIFRVATCSESVANTQTTTEYEINEKILNFDFEYLLVDLARFVRIKSGDPKAEARKKIGTYFLGEQIGGT